MIDSKTAKGRAEVDAVIIGAGFSGLYMLYRLRDVLGLNVRVLETAPRVGGTWYWNRYPGARCDTESYIYCYSFSRELYQEWEWSGRYPFRDELLQYLEHVVERFDLGRDILLDTRVTAARWDDKASRWLLETEDGSAFSAQFLITAIGSLTSAPYVPDLEGLSEFLGTTYHTRSWPEPAPDLSNSVVGVIGTGSTGAQLIPSLAKLAKELVVFQRTAQFMVPAQEAVINRKYLQDMKERYDEIWEKARWSVGGMPWGNNGRSAWDDSADERLQTWEQLWAQGGSRFVGQNYRDVLTDPQVSEMVSEFVRGKIRERVADTDVADDLTPRSYLFGGRRTVVESGYFETFNRPDVHLVNIQKDPIARLYADGVQLLSGRQVAVNVLAFATGFDAVTGPFRKIDFTGREGARLEYLWAQGPRSYLGMTLTGFPNMFMVTGPGSTFGNHAVLMEHQVEWISDAISMTLKRGANSVEASEQSQADWMVWVDEAARSTVQFSTKSWFNGANIPGKPAASYVYLGSYRKYRRYCDRVAEDGYPGLSFT